MFNFLRKKDQSLPNHEQIQDYFEQLYTPFDLSIKQTFQLHSDQMYGEVYYYSLVKLLQCIAITPNDRFLDVGSGLSKVVFQVFLTSQVSNVTGIEIVSTRAIIAEKIYAQIRQDQPSLFSNNRALNLIHGDFLHYDFQHITIAYMCSTVFSIELLDAISKKLNDMPMLKTIISFRRTPNLDNFILTKKLFLHCTWGNVACYIYSRKPQWK